MVNVGDVAMKIAGRDAGMLCVVVDVIDGNFVMVDGETRRRKCNLKHLEFLGKSAKVKKSDGSEEVLKALKDLGLKVHEVKKGKRKERKVKPSRLRKTKAKSEAVVEKKPANKK